MPPGSWAFARATDDADPDSPYSWRLDPSGGGGAIADLGSHIIGLARFILGPITEVNADLETVIKTRRVAPGASERRKIEVDDIARLTVRFARGCSGSIEASWVATGRRIEAGPQHAPYGSFCVAPGHQLGFNDLKTIEVAQFLQAIAGGPENRPDFREAWEIQKVVDRAICSSRERAWLTIS